MNVKEKNNNEILLLSHELSRTGAPIVLRDLAVVLKEMGYSVLVVSFRDGELKEDYEKNDIPIMVYDNQDIEPDFIDRLVADYNIWIVNTLLLWPVVSYVQNTDVNIKWWLHEDEIFFQKCCDAYGSAIDSDNIEYYAAGPYVKDMIDKYLHVESEIVNFGVRQSQYVDAIEAYHTYAKDNGGRVRFVDIGSISYTKAQNVLVDAIKKLPDEYIKQSEFIFIGDVKGADTNILDSIVRLTVRYDNVKLLDSMPQDDIYRIYDNSSVVIVPSIYEPTSAVAVEGLMKKKICICSDICGVSYYLKDNESAYIFPSGDSQALAEKIKYVIDNIELLADIYESGHKVYEQNYSMKCFVTTWKAVLEK